MFCHTIPSWSAPHTSQQDKHRGGREQNVQLVFYSQHEGTWASDPYLQVWPAVLGQPAIRPVRAKRSAHQHNPTITQEGPSMPHHHASMMVLPAGTHALHASIGWQLHPFGCGERKCAASHRQPPRHARGSATTSGSLAAPRERLHQSTHRSAPWSQYVMQP